MYRISTKRHIRSPTQVKVEGLITPQKKKTKILTVTAWGIEPVVKKEPVYEDYRSGNSIASTDSTVTSTESKEVDDWICNESIDSIPSTTNELDNLISPPPAVAVATVIKKEEADYDYETIIHISPRKQTSAIKLSVEMIDITPEFNDENLDQSIMWLHYCRERKDWCADTWEITHKHPCINDREHMIQVNWMMEVITKLNFSRTSFHTAVSIMMRYLTKRTIPLFKMQYQLVAITCLWIVAKLEEDVEERERYEGISHLNSNHHNWYFSAHQFLGLVKNNYSPEDLILSERDIINTLKGDLSLRNCYQWLNLYVSWAKIQYYTMFKRWCTFEKMILCYRMLDMAVMHIQLVDVQPSVLAAAVLVWFYPEDQEQIEQLTRFNGGTVKKYLVKETGDLKDCIHYLNLLCGPTMKQMQQKFASMEQEDLYKEELPLHLDKQEYLQYLLNALYTTRCNSK
jgi:hypothetical protein